MAITSYATLQAAVADTLNRTSLTDQIKVFIQLAEVGLRKDKRVRKLKHASFSITGDDLALPTDLKVLEAWHHDGPTYFGAIETVPIDLLGTIKARRGTTGVPEYAAIVAGKAYFAPAPSTTYATKMSYWRKIDTLSDSTTTNWLLDEHPDIYLYAALVHAAPFLKDDERIPVWAGLLEGLIEELHRQVSDEMYTGSLRRQFEPIG